MFERKTGAEAPAESNAEGGPGLSFERRVERVVTQLAASGTNKLMELIAKEQAKYNATAQGKKRRNTTKELAKSLLTIRTGLVDGGVDGKGEMALACISQGAGCSRKKGSR